MAFDRLKALELVLSEIGLNLSIDTVSDRLIIQKAIYLAQTAVPLGYSFGWYLRGPYSPRLTKDYYEYNQMGNPGPAENRELKDTVKTSLRPVRNLIQNKPAQATLPHWLELLASAHYLNTYTTKDRDAIKGKILETKPHLGYIVDNGLTALQL